MIQAYIFLASWQLFPEKENTNMAKGLNQASIKYKQRGIKRN